VLEEREELVMLRKRLDEWVILLFTYEN
jgi:hypothetical protein